MSTSFNVPEVIAGYGQHLIYLSPGDIIEALKWNFLATPLLVFSLAASKISICLFLLRALAQTRVRFKRSFPYGIIILLTAIAIPSAGYALFPISFIKDLHLQFHRKVVLILLVFCGIV